MKKPAKALSDPIVAASAWARFRRIMAWMSLVGVAVVIVAILWLGRDGAAIPVHMLVATIIGVFLTFMLGTGLMMLAFLSSGTGHDEDAASSGHDPR